MKPGKTAYWIRNTHIFRKDDYICSNCKAKVVKPVSPCPRCGAPMKGTKSNTGWVDEMEAIDAIFEV